MKETGCSRQRLEKGMEQLETGGMVEKRVRPFLKAQRDSREEQKRKKEKINRM